MIPVLEGLGAAVVLASACITGFAVWSWIHHHRTHPNTTVTTPPLPPAVATVCKACGDPVRYITHPGGRADAEALHHAYECAAQRLEAV